MSNQQDLLIDLKKYVKKREESDVSSDLGLRKCRIDISLIKMRKI
jgi:hypothetical protein